MKYKLFASILFVLYSCSDLTQEKNDKITNKITAAKLKKNETKLENHQNKTLEQPKTDCNKYWSDRLHSDSVKNVYINNIISENELTPNNKIFLTELASDLNTKDNLAFENTISPIFRLSNTEIGIFTFPVYQFIENRLIPFSKEMELINRYDTIRSNSMEHFGKIKFYPMILDSIFDKTSKPKIYYYSTDKVDSTQILELGSYLNECLEYFEYSIDTADITINDKILFSSPFKIDLVFEENSNIDSLIKNDYKKECFDCLTSIGLQKTFARLKGTNNLFFIYADTFPINNELDTPSRALILINEKKEIIYLWYGEIDLFGCSCL